MFHVRGSLGKAKGARQGSVSLSLAAGSTRHVYARSMTVASRDPYRSVSRSGHWLAILESVVLLVHRSAAGPVRPAVGLALCLHVGLD